jgi:hypothetical protein
MGVGGSADTIVGWNFATNTAANQIADEGNSNNIGIQNISGVGVGTISWPGGPTSLSGTILTLFLQLDGIMGKYQALAASMSILPGQRTYLIFFTRFL